MYDGQSITSEWRDIPGREGGYQASPTGNIRNAKTGRTLRPAIGGTGYLYLNLPHAERSKRSCAVHQLVAAAFLGPCPDGYAVNHKDGNKANPKAENLEYATRAENLLHAYRTGLNPGHPKKVTDEQVEEMRRTHAAGTASQSEIARRFSISQSQVSRILNKKRRVTKCHFLTTPKTHRPPGTCSTQGTSRSSSTPC